MSVVHVPASEAELSGLLRDSKGPVHLQGTASRNGFHPRTEGSTRVSLRAFDRFVHLEPGDLTCSVQPGLPMAALRAELEPHGIELGCLDGDGTWAGSSPPTHGAPGHPAARHRVRCCSAWTRCWPTARPSVPVHAW